MQRTVEAAIPTRATIEVALKPHKLGEFGAKVACRPSPVERRARALSEQLDPIRYDSIKEMGEIRGSLQADDTSLVAKALRDHTVVPDIHVQPEVAAGIAESLIEDYYKNVVPHDKRVYKTRSTHWRSSHYMGDAAGVKAFQDIEWWYAHSFPGHISRPTTESLLPHLEPLRDLTKWPEGRRDDIKRRLEIIDARATDREDYVAKRGELLGLSPQETLAEQEHYQRAHNYTQILRWGYPRKGFTPDAMMTDVLQVHDHDRQEPLLVEALSQLLYNGEINLEQARKYCSSVDNNVTRGATDNQITLYKEYVYQEALSLYAFEALQSLSELCSYQY